jgi:hypothetical protein
MQGIRQDCSLTLRFLSEWETSSDTLGWLEFVFGSSSAISSDSISCAGYVFGNSSATSSGTMSAESCIGHLLRILNTHSQKILPTCLTSSTGGSSWEGLGHLARWVKRLLALLRNEANDPWLGSSGGGGRSDDCKDIRYWKRKGVNKRTWWASGWVLLKKGLRFLRRELSLSWAMARFSIDRMTYGCHINLWPKYL